MARRAWQWTYRGVARGFAAAFPLAYAAQSPGVWRAAVGDDVAAAFVPLKPDDAEVYWYGLRTHGVHACALLWLGEYLAKVPFDYVARFSFVTLFVGSSLFVWAMYTDAFDSHELAPFEQEVMTYFAFKLLFFGWLAAAGGFVRGRIHA